MSWAGMVAWADVRGVDAAALRGRLALVVDEADLAQRRTGIRLVEQRRHGLAVEHGGRGAMRRSSSPTRRGRRGASRPMTGTVGVGRSSICACVGGAGQAPDGRGSIGRSEQQG